MKTTIVAHTIVATTLAFAAAALTACDNSDFAETSDGESTTGDPNDDPDGGPNNQLNSDDPKFPLGPDFWASKVAWQSRDQIDRDGQGRYLQEITRQSLIKPQTTNFLWDGPTPGCQTWSVGTFQYEVVRRYFSDSALTMLVEEKPIRSYRLSRILEICMTTNEQGQQVPTVSKDDGYFSEGGQLSDEDTAAQNKRPGGGTRVPVGGEPPATGPWIPPTIKSNGVSGTTTDFETGCLIDYTPAARKLGQGWKVDKDRWCSDFELGEIRTYFKIVDGEKVTKMGKVNIFVPTKPQSLMWDCFNRP